MIVLETFLFTLTKYFNYWDDSSRRGFCFLSLCYLISSFIPKTCFYFDIATLTLVKSNNDVHKKVISIFYYKSHRIIKIHFNVIKYRIKCSWQWVKSKLWEQNLFFNLNYRQKDIYFEMDLYLVYFTTTSF